MNRVIKPKVRAKAEMTQSISTPEQTNTFPQSLICFSHLRWDFVFQRPQHILSRLSKIVTVFYIEEPVLISTEKSFWVISKAANNSWTYVPHINSELTKENVNEEIKELMQLFFIAQNPKEFVFWYYTPMAMEFTDHLTAGLTVYDCMDELSAFRFASEKIKVLEKKLLSKAGIVFTGGQSLFEAKKAMHNNIYAFPSSIDKKHFLKGRIPYLEPTDQCFIKGPKIGFYGVIDERLDIALIKYIADMRPEWSIILIGPIVKIDPDVLPKNSNIYYLGCKSYEDLPKYLSGWDVALVPFVINESTQFVSPTKTPEYLCAGKPVVSTPIQDIVEPYGKNRLVCIAKDSDAFIQGIENYLSFKDKAEWQQRIDKFLMTLSWDITCSDMVQLMIETFQKKKNVFDPIDETLPNSLAM